MFIDKVEDCNYFNIIILAGIICVNFLCNILLICAANKDYSGRLEIYFYAINLFKLFKVTQTINLKGL